MTKQTQSATGAVSVDVSAADQGFDRAARALYIGGDGDVAVTMSEGQDVTFAGLPAGTILPVNVITVLNTGTTATNIVAMF